MNTQGCCALLTLLLWLPGGARSVDAQSTEMDIVTKVRLTDCCIEYRGLITLEANDGAYELYEEASPKPTTILIESDGGGAGAAMQLGNWLLDHALDVRVDTFCYSSCANYVFLAGHNKLLASHASLMWHGGVMQPIDRPELEHLLDDMLQTQFPCSTPLHRPAPARQVNHRVRFRPTVASPAAASRIRTGVGI